MILKEIDSNKTEEIKTLEPLADYKKQPVI